MTIWSHSEGCWDTLPPRGSAKGRGGLRGGGRGDKLNAREKIAQGSPLQESDSSSEEEPESRHVLHTRGLGADQAMNFTLQAVEHPQLRPDPLAKACPPPT